MSSEASREWNILLRRKNFTSWGNLMMLKMLWSNTPRVIWTWCRKLRNIIHIFLPIEKTRKMIFSGFTAAVRMHGGQAGGLHQEGPDPAHGGRGEAGQAGEHGEHVMQAHWSMMLLDYPYWWENWWYTQSPSSAGQGNAVLWLANSPQDCLSLVDDVAGLRHSLSLSVKSAPFILRLRWDSYKTWHV